MKTVSVSLLLGRYDLFCLKSYDALWYCSVNMCHLVSLCKKTCNERHFLRADKDKYFTCECLEKK